MGIQSYPNRPSIIKIYCISAVVTFPFHCLQFRGSHAIRVVNILGISSALTTKLCSSQRTFEITNWNEEADKLIFSLYFFKIIWTFKVKQKCEKGFLWRQGLALIRCGLSVSKVLAWLNNLRRAFISLFVSTSHFLCGASLYLLTSIDNLSNKYPHVIPYLKALNKTIMSSRIILYIASSAAGWTAAGILFNSLCNSFLNRFVYIKFQLT